MLFSYFCRVQSIWEQASFTLLTTKFSLQAKYQRDKVQRHFSVWLCAQFFPLFEWLIVTKDNSVRYTLYACKTSKIYLLLLFRWEIYIRYFLQYQWQGKEHLSFSYRKCGTRRDHFHDCVEQRENGLPDQHVFINYILSFKKFTQSSLSTGFRFEE